MNGGFVGFALDQYYLTGESVGAGGGANFYVSSNGTYHATTSGASQSGAFSPINWTYTSPTTYYVYAQLLGPSGVTGDSTNTWLSLSSDRNWSCFAGVGNYKTVSLNVKISTTASDAGILDYALVDYSVGDTGV